MNELKIEFDTGVGDMKAERPELPRAGASTSSADARRMGVAKRDVGFCS